MSSIVSSFIKSTVQSTLSRVVGPGKDLPNINVGEKVDEVDGIWNLYSGFKRDDNTPVTIFIFDVATKKEKLPLAQNAFKKIKMIRHPECLKYIDGVQTDSNIYIVTEAVSPLSTSLQKDGRDPNLLLLGLFKIATAVQFINRDCQYIHGNIKLSSIFVTKSGEWKLGGFDMVSSMKEDMPIITNYAGLMPDMMRICPPEIRTHGWAVLRDQTTVHSTDSWLYAALVTEVYNYRVSAPDQVGQQGNIPPDLYAQLRYFAAPNPSIRPDMTLFLEVGQRKNGYFNGDFIKTVLFLENWSIKEAHEKDAFIRNIASVVQDYPQEFCKFKVLPQLLSALEYGAAPSKIITPILKIGQSLSKPEYDQIIVNALIKLFASPDRSIRLSLLECLETFIDRLDNKVVNDKIFGSIASGFSDVVPLIREQTVKAMLLVAPKLSERTINNDLLRYLGKCQADEEPGIRTNTTICLGKISKHLSESTRKKVLVPAFARSIRDPFPPARHAGLLAFIATAEYYDAEDLATKIVPSIAPCTIDTEKSIRTQAFKAISVFIKKLETIAESMPETAAPVPNPNQPQQSSVPGSGVPTAVSSSDNWGFNTIAKKLTGVNLDQAPGSTPTQTTLAPTSAVPSAQPNTTFTTPRNETIPTLPPPPGSKTNVEFGSFGFTSKTYSSVSSAVDGWEDDLDLNQMHKGMALPSGKDKSGWEDDGWEPFDSPPKTNLASQFTQPAAPKPDFPIDSLFSMNNNGMGMNNNSSTLNSLAGLNMNSSGTSSSSGMPNGWDVDPWASTVMNNPVGNNKSQQKPQKKGGLGAVRTS
ncbi:armadillo-type protein [Paraphysoderma sedebokerense]|nr:armadillo-type protein [Paraphysoderma sedebokerense]KAI9143564.1 armadillo-type protein [Paraphysoderma sedebokerense]